MGRQKGDDHIENQLKRCSKCKQHKPLSEFYPNKHMRDGYSNQCRKCMNEGSKRYRDSHKEYYKEYGRKWYEAHKEEVSAAGRAWYLAHRDDALERSRIRRQEKREEMLPYFREYYKKKWKSDPQHRLSRLASHAIRQSLHENKSGRHWEELVGYTLADLTQYLESQFLPGMTWQNMRHDGWTIDHIKPIKAHSFFSPDDPEFKECFALSNLRPMWAKDNYSKGAKYQGIDYRYVDKSAGGGS